MPLGKLANSEWLKKKKAEEVKGGGDGVIIE